jgi:hypothetical protein
MVRTYLWTEVLMRLYLVNAILPPYPIGELRVSSAYGLHMKKTVVRLGLAISAAAIGGAAAVALQVPALALGNGSSGGGLLGGALGGVTDTVGTVAARPRPQMRRSRPRARLQLMQCPRDP